MVLQALGVVLEVLEAAVGLAALGHAEEGPARGLVDGHVARAQRDLELVAPQHVAKEKLGNACVCGCVCVKETRDTRRGG